MKKLLLAALFLTPSLAMAETWNCTYKSTEGPATETSSFTRVGEYFTYSASYTNDKFKIVKETKGEIVLDFQGISDYEVKLSTNNGTDGKIVFTALADNSQWKGPCSIR